MSAAWPSRSEILAAIELALAGETTVEPRAIGFLGRIADGGHQALAGRHVLVTSGPTHEPIDPVRYIANRSSGKQGHAIAAAAAAAGARVTLVSGPVTLPDPAGVTTIHVESAREMLAAVEQALPADIAIFAAAVADWRVADAAPEKMKKGASGPPALSLVENPDILRSVAAMTAGRPPLVVGFAAETENVLDHARAKLARKGCDLIVANDVGGTGVMGGDANTVHLVSAAGVETWPTLPKDEVAQRLVAHLAGLSRPVCVSVEIAVRRLPHGADLPLPAYETAGAAGLDLRAALGAGESLKLVPSRRSALVPTGLMLQLPDGFEGQVRPRSGLAAKARRHRAECAGHDRQRLSRRGQGAPDQSWRRELRHQSWRPDRPAGGRACDAAPG